MAKSGGRVAAIGEVESGHARGGDVDVRLVGLTKYPWTVIPGGT